MARVLLDIDDPTNRLTLKAILEAEGHQIVTQGAEVAIASDPRQAAQYARGLPTLALARSSEIPAAVAAMRQGVFGYIFVPFQAGEAGMMVRRALAASEVRHREGDNAESGAAGNITIDDAETRLILDTMRRCKHNHTKAARALGIGRNTLWRKLKKIRGAAGTK